MPEFQFQEMFPHGEDTTPYRKLSSDFVGTTKFNGRDVLTVDPQALTLLTAAAKETGVAVVLALLALGLALFVARLIARPIQAIAGFAVMVEDERIPPPLRSPVREANEVATALRLASERLQERTRDLRQTLGIP